MTEEQIERLEHVISRLLDWARAYPTDIFPPPTPEERARITVTFPGLMDRIAADMGRHIGKSMVDMAAELQKVIKQ